MAAIASAPSGSSSGLSTDSSLEKQPVERERGMCKAGRRLKGSVSENMAKNMWQLPRKQFF